MTIANEDVAIPGVKQPERPKLAQIIGPGLITGASDDDPSGIATYSQIGAQFGYDMGWSMLVSYPLMVSIQEISARIGRVTGLGLAGNLRRHFPSWTLHLIIGLLLLANTINLGADLGAMAAALHLLLRGPQLLFVALFGLLSVFLEVFVRYSRYVSVLKWLSLSLLAYVATIFMSDVHWGELARHLVWPHITWSADYYTGLVAVFGTTISPYLFFWQAGEEVEDEKESEQASPLTDAPDQAPFELKRIRLDTYLGMAISNLIALCIIVTTAATLHQHGVTDIATSAQAAEALRPIAGQFAFAVFALGIIGTGLLALPVLAGSAAYALGEARDWPVGLARKPLEGKAFYATIAVSTMIGGCMNFLSLDPVRMLFWSAVINGVVAVPVMVMLMLIAARKNAMGQFVVRGPLKFVGWLSTFVMTLVALGMFVSWLH